MSDHTYFMSCVNQNIGYNQPINLGYYFGADMDMSQVPLVDNGADGIENIHNMPAQVSIKEDNNIYDLSGRATDVRHGGIRIVGNRKILIRR